MVFTSPIFLFFFLPLCLLLYFAAKGKFRNYVLLLMSLCFYAWGEPVYILLMIFSIVINYFLGIFIEKKGKVFLAASLVFNISTLFCFKYLNFFIDSINDIFNCNINMIYIALPIGISFYTFQIMSYTIDVYWKNVSAQKNILNLALYISLFPQLIAGPIVRYIDIEEQIGERTVTVDKIYKGILRFMKGFSKKVLLADQLSPLVAAAFEVNCTFNYSSAGLNWAGIIAYTLQIYFDFSGYSDMAIGLGEIFGFEFVENFNFPYISSSVKEFWRRWHISLSTWFRDYIYIPLGGSRCSKIKSYRNLWIVFCLTGIWHGANWTFVFWGIYYAFFLTIERMRFGKILDRCPMILKHLYTMAVVVFGWVFFRAESMKVALLYIKGMFDFSHNGRMIFHYNMNKQYWFFLIIGCILAIPYGGGRAAFNKLFSEKKYVYLGNIITMSIFLVALCYMIGTGFSPFLYFRF